MRGGRADPCFLDQLDRRCLRSSGVEDTVGSCSEAGGLLGSDVEVFDVSSFSKDELTWTFGMTDTIRILAWCFSSQSYRLGDSIKSNWWPEPDHIQIPSAS